MLSPFAPAERGNGGNPRPAMLRQTDPPIKPQGRANRYSPSRLRRLPVSSRQESSHMTASVHDSACLSDFPEERFAPHPALAPAYQAAVGRGQELMARDRIVICG